MGSPNKGYAYLFDGQYGFILGPFLRRLFNQITIPELYRESLSSLSRKGHIVFVHSTSSTVDAMLMNYRFQREDLPVPRVIFNRKLTLLQPISRSLKLLTGFLAGMPSPFENDFYRRFVHDEGSASLLSLDTVGTKGKPDPILELLKVQRDIDKPVYLIPQRIVYNRSPLKVRDATREEKASSRSFRKVMTLLKAEERGFIEHGEPINLKDVIRHNLGGSKFFEEIATDIRNELQQQLAVLGRNISGAPIRERGFIIRKTIRDPLLQSFLRAHSAQTGQGYEALEETVRKNLEQIASDLSPAMINFLNRSLTWIFNNIYDGLDVGEEGLQSVREMARNGSLVYVPCHKSHFDYLILSYTLFQHWMSVPVIAAGINLSFFPMGTIFRKGGAFFMKRSFKDNPVYAHTFAAYVRTILQERIPLEFFIEGTRSRSGKLMLPKKGLLSMIIQGWESGVTRDVIFVPVYVGYDTVVEEGAYIREMKGAPKEKEGLWALIKAGNVLKNRYGKVYVRFSKPISMNEFMKGKSSYSRMNSEQKEELYDAVAQEIISSIYQQTVATPFSLLSCVVTSYDSALEETALKQGFTVFLDYLKYFGCNRSASLDDEEKAFDEAYALLKSKHLVAVDEPETEGDATLLTTEGEKRIHLEYYKNTILNFFVPASLICNVILREPSGLDEREFRDKVANLAALLESEFILDMESFRKATQYMLDRGIIVQRKTSFSLNEEKRGVAVMFDGLLENYLESYLCVAKFVLKTKDLGKKDPLKAINKYASRIYKKGEIHRYEALCMPVYKGALDTFRAKGIIDERNRLADEKALSTIITDLDSFLEK
ncbi:MAG TPA: 1-acyl-sn-glycerol-3-phosphate acyltransferase [Deltaproteobacteria bacterium]|nr:1-acyl-sn-glycerol-3-phosphate acyltransferase [Deltaproteobacteria bacterium]HOI07124.1 1-acyl-sn-glycerol-3-phosphate acyltransferase [Deltaproteobacteria bacterium]